MLLVFFLKGIVVGMVIAVPVGPVGILCLRRAIFEGEAAGQASGFGAATGDALFGVIAAFGLSFIAQWLVSWEDWLRLAGGCYLLYAGGRALLHPPIDATFGRGGREGLFRAFLSSFFLTLTNPITILVFIGIFAAIGLADAQAAFLPAVALVIGVWVGSLLWWLGLSLGVERFRGSLRVRHLALISRGSGAILFASGAALFITTVLKRLA